MTAPSLSFGLSFNDLYDREGLSRLDAAFAAWLKAGMERPGCQEAVKMRG